MGVASLVLGIVALVFIFLPVLQILALIPAIVGLVLGIIECRKKGKTGQPKSKAVAGTICSAIAMIIITIMIVISVAVVFNDGGIIKKAKQIESKSKPGKVNIQENYYNYNY